MRKAVLVLAAAAIACGKQTFLAAAFVQTPALPNPTGGAGFPQYQILTAYFGTIDTTDPTKIDQSKIAAITDANASVSFHHTADSSVQGDVTEDRWLYPPDAQSTWQASQGTYTLNSKDEPQLTFEANTPYTLVLQKSGADSEAYGARLTPGPSEDIKEFESPAHCNVAIGGVGTTQAPRCIDLPITQSLTVTRDVTGGCVTGQSLPSFVLVGKVDPNNPSAEPEITYKTVPADATSLLQYVLSDVPYRVCSFTIPSTAFPQAGYYVVTLLAVRQGKVSGNAFLGSTALAASGTAGVVHVQ